jgi:hypothetical protein
MMPFHIYRGNVKRNFIRTEIYEKSSNNLGEKVDSSFYSQPGYGLICTDSCSPPRFYASDSDGAILD